MSKKRIAACGLFVGRKERGEEEEKEMEKKEEKEMEKRRAVGRKELDENVGNEQ